MRTHYLILITLMALQGCEKAAQNMYNQPRYKPLAASSLWADGQSARPNEPDTVEYSAGVLAGTSGGRLGVQAPPVAVAPAMPLDDQGKPRGAQPASGVQTASLSNPLPVTAATLARGRERFNIYCAPCHSEAGDGDGMVVRRGFPAPPSFHTNELRNAPDAHFFSVITGGYGVMYPYADRIAAADRWAVIAYIRALQLSQNARLADVPEPMRANLGGGK
jgi:mono/diheme cytochrome c family protein